MMAMKLSTYLELSAKSQVHFAERLGVSPQIVSDWIRGRRRPKFDTAQRIESATGGVVTWREWYPSLKGRAKT